MSDQIQLPDAPADQREVLNAGGVAVWREPVEIGTYEPAEPTVFPMFLNSRVYQGSSGRVYPMPFVERIGRERRTRTWDAIHLENKWLRLMLLPELGGRIHIGYDKVADHDFFYRNNVIKPALVGLAGPWISGGVEFNWPQHHRPGTFMPVETVIERRDDGSAVVWHSDHDPFARMRESHGVHLRPDSTLIELEVRLDNRTEEPRTFLWWANVAARASDEYQSFFPTDVRFVADHARRAVTAFPRADRPYYGVDYPARVTVADPDADRLDFYRNLPVPTSYMVLDTRDDFFGGYDHGRDAGFVHWADRRIAPGKKQWTWGNAPFGHAWDRLLTDDDGPYVELMAGVYTDNQPDFSYLAPDESRRFSQYWYPISRIGVAHQATRDAAISVEVPAPGHVHIGVAVTHVHEDVELTVRSSDAEQRIRCSLSPDSPGTWQLEMPGIEGRGDLTVSVSVGETELVRWEAHPADSVEPAVATEPPAPVEIDSSDELFLIGVHLQQYRHPTRSPEAYFGEVLRRDPGDSRANLAVAARRYGSARFAEAEQHARRALARLTARNPNPADGEASYRLGLILARRDEWAAAGDAFAKSAWDAKWAPAARLASAFISARAGRWEEVIALLSIDDQRGRGRCLRVTALRQLHRDHEAGTELAAILDDDPLNAWARALTGRPIGDPWTAGDVAIDAEAAGDLTLAMEMLEQMAAAAPGAEGNPVPIALYTAALFAERAGHAAEAGELRSRARSADARLCFPSGLVAEAALRAAVAADAHDWRARGLLGTWLYGADRREEAMAEWREVIEGGHADEVILRNAAVAAVNVSGDEDLAALYYQAAIDLAPDESRLWLERDALLERRGATAHERLELLHRRPATANVRDDLLVVTAELLNATDEFAAAHALLIGHELQPWEGGEGKTIAAWEQACLGLARQELEQGDTGAAARWVDAGFDTPPSLGEARHLLAGVAELLVVRGEVLCASGDPDGASSVWETALVDPAAPGFPAGLSEKTYWVGVAARHLGDVDRADQVWDALEIGAARVEALGGTPDYFATSLPSTLLFGISPSVVKRDADRLRRLARDGRAERAVRPRGTLPRA